MSAVELSTVVVGPEKAMPIAEAKSKRTLSETVATYAKYIISSVITMVYLTYIFWGIWTGEAVLPAHMVVHFVIFIFCMTLVFYLEGLQVAILAVEHDDPEQYKDSHPRGYKIMKSCTHANNVERFLVGRQFFTIFVMTMIAQVTTFPNISHLGINSVVWFIFIQTGLPAAVVVTTIGSLQPQLLAAKDPWKFLDLYGSVSVLNLCYGLEITGICTHFAYLLTHIIRATVFPSTVALKNEQKDDSNLALFVDGCKYILSTSVILFYMSYLMWGIFSGEAVLPIHPVAVFIVFCFCGVFLAHLEGLQVAVLVSEAKDTELIKDEYPTAYSTMKRATYEKNVRRFLIGRQFFVIFVVFLINQCTIFPNIATLGADSTVWLVFFQLGFPTALNVLCFFQLPTQLVGNQDPNLFLNRFGPRQTLEVCLFTEWTGLAHFSWVVSALSRATWFRISKDAEKGKKMIAAGAAIEKSADAGNSLSVEELHYELHTDITPVDRGESSAV